MRARQRVALAVVAVMAGPMFAGPLLAAPADAVTHVVAAPKPGKKQDKADKKQNKPDKKNDDNGGSNKKKKKDKPAKKRDRTPPATPVLGDPGVGPGGSVSLPVIAEGGAYVVVAELGGPVVATGTGTGGYTSIGWTTSHGAHSYVVSATDRAGNRSGSAQTSVTVDAIPPRLGGVRLTPGTPSDTRTRLVFGTDVGSVYRVWSDGRQVASGTTARPRAERFLDLPNGRHRVEVVVRDAVGNPRTAVRPVAVRVPRLDITSGFTSDPTERTQTVRVRATPTAKRGVLRLPGQSPVTFAMRRGSASLDLDLQDGTYRRGTVLVRDTQRRTGRTRLPALTVDTVPPTLEVAPDEGAAAEGVVRAAVTAEADAEVRWRVVDAEGDVVGSGEVPVEDGAGVLTADVEKGSYRLVVSATDTFDRTTTVRAGAAVADDPYPLWLVVLSRLALLLAAVLAAVGLVLLVRWARGPDNPLRPAAAGVRRGLTAVRQAAQHRLQVLLAPVTEGDAAATVAALFEPDVDAPRVPVPRLPGRAGGTLPPDDEVFHRTPVLLYETTDDRDDGLVLGSRTAELVVGRGQIALVDDRTGEIWSGRIALLAHVEDDTTMVLPEGEDGWIGVVYADRELTRPALDLVAADHSERRLTPAGTTGTR